MWVLLLIAMNVHDSQDQPAHLEIPFPDRASCEIAARNYTYDLKFKNFKIVGSCQQRN
jgi:hypothetical protein